MRRNYPAIAFERYADDVISHCHSEKEARRLPEALQEQGLLEVCPSSAGRCPALRCRAREPLLTLGLPALHHACCCKRSDQFFQGSAGLPDAPRHSLSAVVDAVSGDPLDPEQPGFTGGDGAICQTPPADAQRIAGHRFRNVALRFHLPAAVDPAGCGLL